MYCYTVVAVIAALSTQTFIATIKRSRADRTCPPDHLRCDSGQCVDKTAFCRGEIWCRYGSLTSERVNCSGVKCQEGYTKCPFINKCIKISHLCDGKNDCGDNSDEDPAFCDDLAEGACGRKAVDIVIGLDQSDSLGQFGSPSTAWQHSLDFAISIVNSFVVSPDLARISVAKLNHNITVAFDFDAYKNSRDVVTAIRKLTMDGGNPIMPTDQLKILWQIFAYTRPKAQKLLVTTVSPEIARVAQTDKTVLSELALLKNENITSYFIIVKEPINERDWFAEKQVGTSMGLFVRFIPRYDQLILHIFPQILTVFCSRPNLTSAASSSQFGANKASSELFVALSSLVGLLVVVTASVVGCFLYARFRRPHKSAETRQNVVSIYDDIVESDVDEGATYDDISGPYIGLDKTTRESHSRQTGYERVGQTDDNQQDITVISSDHDCPFSSGNADATGDNAEELPGRRDNSNYIEILPEEDEL